MKLKSVFSSGKMNKDLDERLVPKGEYRDALNVRVVGSSGSDVGAVENSVSNQALTQLDFGANAVCIGSIADDANKKIYWFVRSDTGSFVSEYDIENDSSTFILKDTRSWKTNVLNFYKTNFIEGNILIDIDNDKRFLFFTDGINPPRKIEIESARLIDSNTYTKFDLDVIKQPPLNPPVVTLTNASPNENNIKERFVYFGYRFEYVHGEYSALSPFSEVAFLPGTFSFDFSTGLNTCMVNSFSSASIQFETGSSDVVAIDLVFKESNSTNVYVIESFNKEDELINNNSTHSYTFDNSKVYKVLPEKELLRVYDNVPLTAKTQQLIGNRIVYANYTENFNLVDANGDSIAFNIAPSLNSTAISSGNVQKSVKTNVDYEIGMVYLDDYGRSTSVITSKNSKINVPLSASKTHNRINVSINHLPPAFATHYRMYVKQSKSTYENISPAIFHFEPSTGYSYILLNGNDKNKVKEGDFLVVKADTRGQKTSLVETQVLEIKEQNTNFLALKEDANYPGASDTPISEQGGVYMKIKPVGFSFTTDDYERTEIDDFDTTSNRLSDPLANSQSHSSFIEGPNVYPASASTSTAASITVAGNYNVSNQFSRITITIDSVSGSGDTFTTTVTQLDNQTSTNLTVTGQAITPGVPISINNAAGATGLTVDFASSTGHTVGDKWTVNARPSTFSYARNSKAFATIRSFPKASEDIPLGTVINFTYDEYNESVQFVTHEFVSDRTYVNLEEWYHESGAKATLTASIDESRIFFVRGTYGGDSSNITNNTTDDLLMVIRSLGTQNNDLDSKVKVKTNVIYLERQSTDIPTFETRAEDKNDEVFYELPKTYQITNGYHTVGSPGTSQTHLVAASLTLEFFNCFSWGNCIESYKVKDDFNAKFFKLENRPSANLKDYKKNHRTTSLTYSNVYDQTTKYNGLNEFNLSTANYKDLDDFYGEISKIVSRENDLTVFQENRVSKILFNKNVLFNADGTGNVSSTSSVLGQDVPYLGEYGVTSNPFAVTLWGGRIYFVDERRRVVCRLSQDGITQISDFGMIDWFNDNLGTTLPPLGIASYDPRDRQYSLSLKGTQEEWREDQVECEILYDSGDFDSDGIVNSLDPDDDNDGTPDTQDAFPFDASETTDSDGDGIGDNADTDDDGDGILDTNESSVAARTNANEELTLDTDSDGILDFADPDDDNDGLSDIEEAALGTNPLLADTDSDSVNDKDDAFPTNASESVDTDGDGIGNNADPDDDNDGVLDSSDAFPLDSSETTDTDSDGVGDNADPDDDNDGIPDVDEVDTDREPPVDDIDTDDDNDGVLDVNDAFPLDPTETTDTDSDGTGDNADTDDDNDGVLDTQDAFPLDPTETVDTDSDGTGDNADTDDDNDGVLDTQDAFPLDATETTDTDSDGIGDNADTDDDNDGVLDVQDAFPLDSTESVDTDSDGIGNNADTDDDGDGVADSSDAFPLDPTESVDTDSDGIGDNADTDDDNDGTPDTSDAFPLDPSETTDTDGDGTGDNADTDDDNDGTPDSSDAFPLDATETTDTDSDGVGDNADTDDDNDGVLDSADAFPLDATETTDTDSDGIGDNADLDDDGDGISDAYETQLGTNPLDSTDTPTDTDSDGIPNAIDTDDDNDGTPDTSDAFPLDSTETTDTDGDGTGDNADTDDDNDGVSDADEIAAGTDPLDSTSTPPDTDGDGTLDYLDTDDDNDGVLDVNDAFPLDASESVDTDGDGIGNNADTDDDNDGLTDAQEATAGTNPLLADTDSDFIVDSVDPDPLDSSNPTVSDTSGAGRSSSCTPPETHHYFPNAQPLYGSGSSSSSYRLPGDFFNDNATQTDSALSIIPKGSSAITISDNIYLSGAGTVLISSLNLTDTPKFNDGINGNSAGLTFNDRLITKAAAVAAGYTIGIMRNQDESVKPLTGQSVNDIPDDAILQAHTTDLGTNPNNGFPAPNNVNSAVAICVPIGFKEITILRSVNTNLRDTSSNNDQLHPSLVQTLATHCGDLWFEVTSGLSSTQQPITTGTDSTGLNGPVTAVVNQSLTFPQVTAYTEPSGQSTVTFSDKYHAVDGGDAFRVSGVTSISGGLSSFNTRIGPLFRQHGFNQETIKIHTYYNTLPPVTVNIKNRDFGQTYSNTAQIVASAPSGDIGSGITIDSNGNILVTSMGSTTYASSVSHPDDSSIVIGTGTNFKAQFIKLDTLGDLEWQLQRTGSGNNNTYPATVGKTESSPGSNSTTGSALPFSQWGDTTVITNGTSTLNANAGLELIGGSFFDKFANVSGTVDATITIVKTVIDFVPKYGLLITTSSTPPTISSAVTSIFYKRLYFNNTLQPFIGKTLTIDNTISTSGYFTGQPQTTRYTSSFNNVNDFAFLGFTSSTYTGSGCLNVGDSYIISGTDGTTSFSGTWEIISSSSNMAQGKAVTQRPASIWSCGSGGSSNALAFSSTSQQYWFISRVDSNGVDHSAAMEVLSKVISLSGTANPNYSGNQPTITFGINPSP